MLKTFSVLTLIGLMGACAHTGDMPTVRAGNDPDSSKVRTDAQRSRGAIGAAESNAIAGHVR